MVFFLLQNVISVKLKLAKEPRNVSKFRLLLKHTDEAILR